MAHIKNRVEKPWRIDRASFPAKPRMSLMIPAWVDGTPCPVDKLEGAQAWSGATKAVSVFVIRGTDVLIQRRAFWANIIRPGLVAIPACHPILTGTRRPRSVRHGVYARNWDQRLQIRTSRPCRIPAPMWGQG